MPSVALLPALVTVILGVASPPVRPAVFVGRSANAPLAPLGSSLPQPLPSQPQLSSAPAVVAERRQQDLAAANALSGLNNLVSAPNIFSSAGAVAEGKFERPPPLGREEELELVRRALFFVASTNAERSLAEQATLRARMHAAAHAAAPAAFHVFNHEEVVAEMRRQAEAKREARFKAAQRRIGTNKALATEMPVDVEEDLSDTEFRLTVALGRAAYNQLFHHHQKLVYYEVNKVWKGWGSATVLEKADFLQEGAQGLLRAIRLFDSSRGVRFSTYASWHVRAFVLRALRDKSHLVRLPQSLQVDMAQIRKARYRYAVESHGHAPSDAALADMLHWPPSRVEAALQGLASASATSLDADNGGYSTAFNPEPRAPMACRVASPKHTSAHAENAVYAKQLKTTLREVMAERDPRRIQITRLKYGLEDGVEWTYPMLSRRFNQTTNVLKGIVRTEVNFLRRSKKEALQDFANHL